MLLDKRIPFKPFEYQWAYDYWFKQQNAHWLHTEIQMQSDIRDWEQHLTDKDKSVIGNILKGFAQTETEVEDYWSTKVTQWFPKPEIKMMATAFGAFETIHATAYSYLNDTLGLDDFQAFLHDQATMNKLQSLMEVNNTEQQSVQDIARSIAIFSACAEGIQLFSSFAVLLSFRLKNRLKGIGQQMIFSIKDESLHSEAGCKLFRVLIDEYSNQINHSELEVTIKQAMDLALDVEFKYIDKIFEQGDLDTITKAQLKNFMCDRYNRKAKELGFSFARPVNEELYEQTRWFYQIVAGEMQTDFFDNRETGYAKPNQDWDSDNLFD